MPRESFGLTVKRIKRWWRSQRDPLEALLYDPELDGGAPRIEPPRPGRPRNLTKAQLFPCWYCKKDRPHRTFEAGPERGTTFCTICGHSPNRNADPKRRAGFSA